jgi:shikimate kinase
MTSIPPRKPAIILVGFMGAGKSSVGRALAKYLGWGFEDLDTRIEQHENRTVPEVFEASGEAYFRRAEQNALREILAELRDASRKVIALGGGTFAQDSCTKLIRDSAIPTVFLDAHIDELWRRCNQQTEKPGLLRPMLSSSQAFRDLYEMRRPFYLEASCRLETTGKTVDEVVAELIQAHLLGYTTTGGARGE